MTMNRFWLAREVGSAMAVEAERWAPYETGGVLLGYWSEEEDEPVVTSLIGPGANAVHERYSFVPDHDYHVREIARQYKSSQRRITYLGDWHTHPGGSGNLSELDLRTLRRVAKEPKARASRPIMIVLAPGPNWEAFGWRAQFPSRKLFERKFKVLSLTPCYFETP